MKINKDVVPKTLQEAVKLIVDGLEFSDRSAILQPNSDIVVQAHHFFGTRTRNNWSLWEREAPIVKWFRENLHIGHADDISTIIMENVAAEVRGETYDPTESVSRFHKHWRQYNCNEFGELL